MGIFVFVVTSSGKTVKNCSSAGTVAGFLPNVSSIVLTGSSHAGICSASAEIARQSWTRMVRGPVWYFSNAVKSVSLNRTRSSPPISARS